MKTQHSLDHQNNDGKSKAVPVALGLCVALLLAAGCTTPPQRIPFDVKNLESIGDLANGFTPSAGKNFSCANGVAYEMQWVKVVGFGTEDRDPARDETLEAVGWTRPHGTMPFWPAGTPGLVGFGYCDEPANPLASVAHAISGNGDISVGYMTCQGKARAVFWVKDPSMNGAATKLPFPASRPPDQSSQALDTTAWGDKIVGFTSPSASSDADNASRLPVVWVYNGASYDATVLPVSGSGIATDAGQANGVNGFGDTIVGCVYVASQGRAASSRPCYWNLNSAGGYDLQLFPGNEIGMANDICARPPPMGSLAAERAVGYIMSGGRPGARLWKRPAGESVFTAHEDIPLLPGDVMGVALAVNENATAIVGYSVSTASVTNAFYWKLGSGTQPMIDVIAADGISTTGWQLHQARGMAGEAVVGVGARDGHEEGWVYYTLHFSDPWYNPIADDQVPPRLARGTDYVPPIPDKWWNDIPRRFPNRPPLNPAGPRPTPTRPNR